MTQLGTISAGRGFPCAAAAALPILTAVVLSGCGQHQGGPPGGMGGFSVPVTAQPMKRGAIDQSFTVSATVAPLQHAVLSSVIPGTILTVNGQIGQHVLKGDLLVQIDDSTLQAQLSQNDALLAAAQARYASAKANASGTMSSSNAGLASARSAADSADAELRRDLALLKQGYISQQAVDQQQATTAAADAALRSAEVQATNASLSGTSSSALADLRNAQAAVTSAAAASALIQAQIAQSNVRAPFDGVIVSRSVDPGNLAAPGTPLMVVDQLDPVYVNAGISGDQLKFVHAGTPVTVSVSSVPGRSWRGAVEFFNLSAEPGTVTYMARIRLANPDLVLRGGMVAQAAFVQAHKSDALLAPTASVYQTDTGYSMFIIQGGKATVVPVETGLQNDQWTEVTGKGLAPNVLAILNHSATLQPNTPVMALPAGGGPPGGGPPGAAPGGKPAGGAKPMGGAKPAGGAKSIGTATPKAGQH
jgi:HlyD family secretion protein